MGNALDKLNYIAGTKTAIKDSIVSKGVVVDGDTFRSYADKVAEIGGYQRPSDWLTMPVLEQGDEQWSGLFPVYNADGNFCAISATGDYTVDWGDGSAPENIASGVTAEHEFNYASIVQTPCSRGYKQAIVTVTPQVGSSLLTINCVLLHSKICPSGNDSVKWLDIVVAGDSITDCNPYDAVNNSVYCGLLEKFTFVGTNLITDFSYFLAYCPVLQYVPLFDTSNGTIFYNFLSNSFALQSLPLFDTSKGTDFRFFLSYSAIQTIPQFDTSLGEDFSFFLGYCPTLQIIPLYDVSLGTNFNNAFSGNSALAVGKLSGTAEDISYAGCLLSASAIEDIFDGLATVVGKTITITGNYGVADLTAPQLAIATGKGWTVVTS